MADSHDCNETNRRTVLKAIGVGAVGTTGVLGSSGSAVADHGGDHYTNSLYEPHFPDPEIHRADDGTWWAYGTNMDRENDSDELLVTILSSTDLVNWTFEGEAFDTRPGWTYGSIWAPNVHYFDGEWVMFYSLEPRPWESGEFGIGLATSDTPDGPFTDHGQVIGDGDTGGGTIDAYFVEHQGTPYLFWGSFQGIYVAELTSDLQDVDMSTATQLAGDAYEGTIHYERNGYHYLFVSTGTCCDGHSSTYEYEVGRSTDFFGPYVDQNGVDLLDYDDHNEGVPVLTGSAQFPGAAHGDITTYDDGSEWMIYHAYNADEPEFIDGVPRRVLMMDRIDWEDDWPVIGCDGTPSDVAAVPGSGTHCHDDGDNGGPITAGTYRLSNVNSGLYLEVGDADTSEGANVNQWSDTGHPCQEWNVIKNGDGTSRLENVNSGYVLSAADGSTSEGASLVQRSWSDDADQRWAVIDNGDGTYRLENNANGYVADVLDASSDDGADVIQWSWRDSDNQKWTFDPV
ncbi:family 43 glycosylhydrolase [Natronorubrum halophilum]|uniref:family 43 glycosylhydrolase n=1 Tax=Natronorubrum halophilum TaxID=1702106 RepID=UPI000EF6C489|nr:family 43 glycosylhydrolase [Natronorubrum halophilum]